MIRTQNIKHKTQNTDKKNPEDGLGSVLCALSSDSDHGGNIYRIAEELGVIEDQLIDFSASINPLGVSKKVKDAIKKELGSLVNYPDPDTKALREKLALHHGIDPDSIICGNGSTELIYLIPRALKPESVLIPAPTFSEYERAVRTQNTEHRAQIKYLELRESEGFRIRHDEFIGAMSKPNWSKKQKAKSKDTGNENLGSWFCAPGSVRLAFLCNPNNPTGHLLEKDDVLKIAEAARKMRCCLVVDEAFIDFRPEESVIGYVQDNPYLIVLRSMTKFYALTGLRIGYGVFHPALISKVKEFKEPWTVNNLAQKAAIAALEDIAYAERTFELMKKEKEFMENGFRMLGINYYPSSANYYLIKISPNPSLGKRGIVSSLREKGILVRDCSNFKGLDGSYVRVAVKSRKDNKRLLKELNNIICKIPLHPPFSKEENVCPSLEKRG